MCLPLLLLALGGDGAERTSPWLELDRAIQGLALDADESPLSWGGLVRVFYSASPEEATAGSAEASGIFFEDVDLYFAHRGPVIGWRISADFDAALDEGSATLEDAHGIWRRGELVALTLGQFKPHVLRSGSIPADGLLFRDRTFLGAAFDQWDDGVGLEGTYDQFQWWLAVTDGENGQDADHFWSARGEWALFDAPWEDIEGARNAPNHLRVVLGGALFSDVSQSSSDGGGFGLDLACTFGPYSLHGEWAKLDDEFTRTIDVFNGYTLAIGDGKPLSGTLSCVLSPRSELALRFQQADDADETFAAGACATWSPLPAFRVIADVSRVEGDTRDFSLLSLGLQLGSSGITSPTGPSSGR